MKAYIVKNIMLGLYEMLIDTRFSKNKDVFREGYEKVTKGIHFCVEVDSECMGFENDGNTHHPEWEGRCVVFFHAIILADHKVFTYLQETRTVPTNGIPQTGWKNTSNHASCWRQGLDELTAIGFSAADTAWQNCPEEHTNNNKDTRVDFSLGHGLFVDKPFQLVDVDYESDLEIDSSGYHKKITAVRKLEGVSLLV
jgi:hypothetical protein